MKKLLAALVLVGSPAMAQTYPSPTVNALTSTTVTSNTVTATTANATTLNDHTLIMNLAGATSVVANTPLNGIYGTGGGALVAMCPGYGFGCPSIGNINSQFATVTTTIGNPGTLEVGQFAYMVTATGYAPPWATSTGYTSSSFVTANGNSYQETVASCTSSGSGSGPSGTGTGIVDNTCRWNDIGLAGNNGKLAFNSTNLVQTGGGQAWDADFNTYITSGWLANFATGVEIDVTNNSGRDATAGGSLNIPLLYLGGGVGTAPITSYVQISPYALNGTNYMAHEGLWFNGTYAVKDHNIRFSDSSTVGIFDDASSTHATASYYDGSTSLQGIALAGTYTSGVALYADAAIQGEVFQLVNFKKTVATLPTCNSTAEGSLIEVTDASAPTWNATLTGGGAVKALAFCNGTNWTAH